MGHLTLLLLRWLETVGLIEGPETAEMVAEQRLPCLLLLWLHGQMIILRGVKHKQHISLASSISCLLWHDMTTYAQ